MTFLANIYSASGSIFILNFSYKILWNFHKIFFNFYRISLLRIRADQAIFLTDLREWRDIKVLAILAQNIFQKLLQKSNLRFMKGNLK